MTALPDIDAVTVTVRSDFGREGCVRDERCRWFRAQMRERLLGVYIGEGAPGPSQRMVAWMPVGRMNREDLVERMRRHSKSAAIRQARRAERLGHRCRAFDPREHVAELVAINQSLPERNHKPMSAAYLRSEAELSRDAATATEFQPPLCPRHWDRWRGVFNADDCLVGYARIRRNGTYALYAQWLGHGDHLAFGVMHLLHREVVSWLMSDDEPCVNGLEHLVYAAWLSGGSGLQQWKRAAGFDPAWLLLDPAEAEDEQ